DYFASRIENFNKSCKNEKVKEILNQIHEMVLEARKDYTNEIGLLKDSKVNDLFGFLRDSPEIMEYEDFEDYCLIAEEFKQHRDDTYIGYSTNKRNNVIVTLVNADLAKRFNSLLDKNRIFVMMSGTLHSDQVLKDVFGIKNYVIIEAETKEHGTVNRVFTRLEKNFRYKEFRDGTVSRENYLKALEKCIETAKRPVLIHVNAISDLPNEEEKEQYGLNLLKTQLEFTEEQERFRLGELLQIFKQGKIDILYSTKCGRGVDLPGEMCNSIIFTKYPYPSMDSLFWKVLKKSNPENFNKFYFDKSRREYVQKIYRGLRSKEDKVYLLSPDIRVMA
ncbi:hypothetical protein HYT58_01800, partial [Candidatus Woesearchaeota archaeon]|nr:hypothetical protein [Candidatus Woesearchaeota archaeon]